MSQRQWEQMVSMRNAVSSIAESMRVEFEIVK